MNGYIKAVLAGVILTGLFASAGCVSIDKYQEARKANRDLREQQDVLLNKIELIKGDQGGLQSNIDEHRERIRILTNKCENYETSVTNLTRTRDELQQKLTDMAHGGTPPPIGAELPPQLNTALQ
ncbi:MAG TPA: hypothetical protein ENL03_02885, partial [Phycisphaerae bacterium]|nr:hypothetical protein [Phycisphaerae bacterium]